MDIGKLKLKIINGLIWTFAERMLSQMITLVISILLARILLPSDYGSIAIILVFINIANVFVNTGFGEALVQRKEYSSIEYSSMFYFALLVSSFMYVGIYMIAPLVAVFYDFPILTDTLRILALKLPLASINTIQRAFVSKNMIFKKVFISTSGSVLISGTFGLILAACGAGIWSLVVQNLLCTITEILILFYVIPWRPSMSFSFCAIKEIIYSALQLAFSSMINAMYCEMYNLTIGKVFDMSSLAFYNRGNQFPALIFSNIDLVIGRVLFPAMTQISDDLILLKNASRKSLKLNAMILYPFLAILFCIAPSLIEVLLTQKWLMALPFLQLGCFYFICQPIQTINWQILKSLGRSDLCLKLEILKKIIGIIILVISFKYSLYVVACGNVLVAFLSMVVNVVTVSKFINYTLKDQLFDIFIFLIFSMCSAVAMYSIQIVSTNIYFLIFIQPLLGISVYVVLLIIAGNSEFKYFIEVVHKRMKEDV